MVRHDPYSRYHYRFSGIQERHQVSPKYPDPGKGAYLAIYEIETSDIEKTMEAHRKNLEEKYAKGRFSDLAEIVSRRLCKVS